MRASWRRDCDVVEHGHDGSRTPQQPKGTTWASSSCGWTTRGAASAAATGAPYRFPAAGGDIRKLHKEPATYRWVVTDSGGRIDSVYIGETGNLGRRLHNYLSPPSIMHTASRIHEALSKKVDSGCEVTLEIAEWRSIRVGSAELPLADLEKKTTRVLLEHALLAESNQSGIHALNA
jgi:hypothetical protein